MSRPHANRSVRLFVQNVPRGSSEEALRRHFEAATSPGAVVDLVVRNTCASVRMRDELAGERARRELHGRPFRGIRLSVHRFRGIKIYVGGLPEECAAEDLLPLFEEFGPVAECVVVKDYGFVHMENEKDGKAAIIQLNGVELKGRRMIVKRSVNDRKTIVRKQNSEQETSVRGDTFPDPYYGDQPPPSHDQDYRPQLPSGHSAAYRNGAESEFYGYPEPSSSRSRSAQSHFYGSKSYDSHHADYENQDDYDMRDDMPASYSPQFFDSMSARDRAPVDVPYQPAPDRLAPAYRALSPRSRFPRSPQRTISSLGEMWPETTSRPSLYERVRLTPPPTISYEDPYRDEYVVNKRRMMKEMEDSYGPPYEYVRLSPPHSSGDNFDRRGNGPNKRYTARSGSASHYAERLDSARYPERVDSARYTERADSARYPERLDSARYPERSGSDYRHRPYERMCLSPPRRSRENYRSYR